MPFDIEGAKRSGYSDSEIADYLAKQKNFDAGSARQAGYTDEQILAHLAEPASNDAPANRQAVDTSLTMGERLVSSLPKGAQDWLANPSIGPVGIGQGSRVHGVAMGMADPVVGAVQLGANIAGMGEDVNRKIAEKSGEYNQARAAQGRGGFDGARLAGNLLSPANAAVASAVPLRAASLVGKAAQGGAAGIVGASIAPVENDENYAATKLQQIMGGGIAGAVLGPIGGKVASTIARIKNRNSPSEIARATDEIVSAGVERMKQDGVAMQQAQINAMRQQVSEALKGGRKLDVAARARAIDFEELGIPPTLGQVTREAGQFSKEKNLRGLAGVGDPLLARFEQQGRQLRSKVSAPAEGAIDEFGAGERIMQSIKSADDEMSSKVRGLYDAARKSTQKELDVPTTGLADDFARVLDEFGDKVPSGVRNQFEKYGLIKGTQQRVFNFDEADKLLKVINANVGNDKVSNTALGQLRIAVKQAIASADDAGGPFAPAVAAARERFAVHDAAPAFKAAAEGDISAQDFVRRFLVSGKADDVKNLAKFMPEDAKSEARSQMAKSLYKAAYGEDLAGDKAFSQNAYNKLLNSSGFKQKLSAFFSPAEVKEFEQIGRVGAYINSFPANHTVNTSNTAAALFNASQIPGVPAVVGLLGSAKNAATNQIAVRSALSASPKNALADLRPDQIRDINRMLTYSGAVAPALLGAGSRDKR